MNTADTQIDILIQDIFPYILENSSFYKKHLSSVKDYSNFSSIPFTDGQTLALHGKKMLCKSLSTVTRIRSFYTSGSTALPKRVYFDEDDMKRTISFFAKYMENIAPDKGTVLILMSDAKVGSIADLLQKALSRIHRKSIIAGRLSSLQGILPLLHEASCIVAMPADAIYLCRIFPFIRPASVLLSADYVPNSIKESITEIWQTKVYEHYGLTESCYGLAVQCDELKDMHIRNEDFYVEIIDPGTLLPLEYGMSGEVVISSLKKSAQPFIRYRTGDMAVLGMDKCTCGYNMPSLKKVFGRIENLNNKINIHNLDEKIFSFPQVLSYNASIKGEKLIVIIEGGSIEESKLELPADIHLEIKYRPCPPWQYPGKREL